MINKIKIKPCASLPGQGVKHVNCELRTWRRPWNLVILDFYVIENLVQSLYFNYLNHCLIPETYCSHIEPLRFEQILPN